MRFDHSLRVVLSVISALAPALQTSVPQGQQRGEEQSLPFRGEWPRASFEVVKEEVKLGIQELAKPDTIAAGTASRIRSWLPGDITLDKGSAIRIPAGAAGPPPEAPAAAGKRMQKWSVSYPLKYRAVPLAKFSDVT